MPEVKICPSGSPAQDIPVSKQQKLEQALDSIRKKYGEDSVVRGSLLHKKDD